MTNDDLKMLQNLPLNLKIAKSKLRIQEWYNHWTEQDILQYLHTYQVQYCSIYGDIIKKPNGNYTTTGLHRTGCMFCMYGIRQDGEINRFQRMQHTHPNIYNYCMKSAEKGGLGLKEVLSFMNIPYEDNQLYLDEKN